MPATKTNACAEAQEYDTEPEAAPVVTAMLFVFEVAV
jgi:hypothetical protein